jgi:ABC-type sulfate/molybdate transport systems ATPase subunit
MQIDETMQTLAAMAQCLTDEEARMLLDQPKTDLDPDVRAAIESILRWRLSRGQREATP